MPTRSTDNHPVPVTGDDLCEVIGQAITVLSVVISAASLTLKISNLIRSALEGFCDDGTNAGSGGSVREP